MPYYYSVDFTYLINIHSQADILFATEGTKIVDTDTFSWLKNAVLAETPSQTPLGKLIALSRYPSCTWRPLPGGEMKGRIRKGRVGEEKNDRGSGGGEGKGLAH